jgi:hypothetical protein
LANTPQQGSALVPAWSLAGARCIHRRIRNGTVAAPDTSVGPFRPSFSSAPTEAFGTIPAIPLKKTFRPISGKALSARLGLAARSPPDGLGYGRMRKSPYSHQLKFISHILLDKGPSVSHNGQIGGEISRYSLTAANSLFGGEKLGSKNHTISLIDVSDVLFLN